MAVNKVGGTNPVNTVRPLYGVFMRDQVAQLRSNIQVTLQDLKDGIAGKGGTKLTNIETADAKKAATALNKAIGDLKPVFGGGSFPVDTARANMGRTNSDGNHPIAMYGVFLNQDLAKYKTEVQNNIQMIQDGIKNGQLSGDAAKEGTKALKQLQTALKDLGGISF